MNFQVKRFLGAEDGTVTVDWIVVVGFAIGIAVALTLSLGATTMSHGEEIGATFQARSIPTY